jgi:serine/threonine protein kinase
MAVSIPAPAEPDESDQNWSPSVAFSVFKKETGGADGDDEVTHVGSAAPGQAEAAARAPSVIGRTIAGKYRLDAVIGSGGMGSVYRASRLLIGDQVAIKLLHHQHVSEAQASERFRREAQAAARLKHPNAVSIYDFGLTKDGLLYLVMELAEGQSLRRVIKEQGPLTPAVAAEIINQVCAALDEAHRQQIVHRDLKPDNILVNHKITSLQVKVLDFGIAKLVDVTTSNLTQTGSTMGTPRYMSPEQCLGEELDNRSDIYSLGIVLYEMLVGAVPFNAPTSTALVLQQVNKPPPPLREININISRPVEEVVLHALAKRREDRPQSARAFAAEFSAAVDGGGGRPAPRPPIPKDPGLDPTVVLRPTPRPSGPTTPKPINYGFWIPLILVGALLLAVGVIAGLLIDASNKRSGPDTVSTTSGRDGNASDNRTVSQPSSTSEPARSTAPTPENITTPAPRVEQNAPIVKSNPGLPYSFQRTYQGTIGKKSAHLEFFLKKTGDYVGGRAETNLSWDELPLAQIRPDGYFRLDGKEKGGRVTGVYSGWLSPDGTIRDGSYFHIATQKTSPFQVR